MSFFKRGEKHALAVVMTGVKLGERLLTIGCSDGSLVTAISAKVGISGRACALVSSEEDLARARRAAERAGLLIEIEKGDLTNFPYDDRAFDLVVIDNQVGLLSNMKPEERVALLQQARRTLTPRGRAIIVERAPRSGLGALLQGTVAVDPHYQASGGALTALRAEGFKAVRQLAERDGLSFFEGIV